MHLGDWKRRKKKKTHTFKILHLIVKVEFKNYRIKQSTGIWKEKKGGQEEKT